MDRPPGREIRLPKIRREYLWALAGYTALALFFLRDAVFRGRILFRRDINMVWLPQVETFVRCVAAGSWPLWDPLSGFGRPLLADPRAEILYPPTWFNLVLSPGTYYTAFAVIHLVFSGLGMVALARRWGLSSPSAFVTGAVWISSGPFLSLVSMWHHLAGAAWIPWIFLAGEAALDSGRSFHVLLWAGTIAAQIFAGSPDFTALTVPALGLYVLQRWYGASGLAARRTLWAGGLAIALGLALSAIQWLPTAEWAQRSGRLALPYETRTIWSLHPAALLEVLFPMSLAGVPLRPSIQATVLGPREPWLHSIYLGAPAFVLAAAGALVPGPRRAFLATVALLAILFSLGSHSPFYAAATTALWPLRALRYPVKAMVIAALALSLLAGMGFDAWRQDKERGPRLTGRVMGILVAFLVLALSGALLTAFLAEHWGPLLLSPEAGPSYTALAAPLASAFALSACLTAAVLFLARVGKGRLGGASLTSLLLLLIVGPLADAHRNLHWTAHADLYRHRPALLSLLDPSDHPRLYVYDYSIRGPGGVNNAGSYRLRGVPEGWTPLEATVFGVHMYLNPPTASRWGLAGSYDRDILGFDPRPLARLNDHLREVEDTPAHLQLLRLAGVRYALALTPAEWWKDLVPVAEVPSVFQDPVHILKVPDPLPRAYVVTGTRVADGDAALAVLGDPGFDPTQEIVLADGIPTPASPSTAGSATIVEMKPDRIRIDVQLAAPGYVVLADAYDPGWHTTVDGRPGSLLRANVAFRAVPVPGGNHVVEMTYRPPSLIVGSLVSGGALVLGGLALARDARRRRGSGGGVAAA